MRVRKTETNTRVIPRKKAVLKNLAIFPEKHLCWSLYLKRDLNTGVFCVTILKNICKRWELKTFAIIIFKFVFHIKWLSTKQ